MVDEPRVCAVCGRMGTVEWHCYSSDIFNQSACSAGGGVGIYLCADMCHPTVHRLMEDHATEGCSRVAVEELIVRSEAIVSAGRTYRRKER